MRGRVRMERAVVVAKGQVSMERAAAAKVVARAAVAMAVVRAKVVHVRF